MYALQEQHGHLIVLSFKRLAAFKFMQHMREQRAVVTYLNCGDGAILKGQQVTLNSTEGALSF